MSVDGSSTNGVAGESESSRRGGAVGYGSLGQSGVRGSERSGGYGSFGQRGANGGEETLVRGGRNGGEGQNTVAMSAQIPSGDF